MNYFPGSDQYPGVTPLQEVLPLGLLPAANALIEGEIHTVGMGRVTLLCQYAKTRVVGPPDTFVGTGVVLTLYLSPYSLTSDVPAGESEWWPISVVKTETVAGGTVNAVIAEYGTITYTGVAVDDTLESWTLDFSLPSHAERIQISAAELFPAQNGGTRGSFGCYALLSGDPGGEFGWTLKQQDPGVVQIAGGALDANLQVGDVDVADGNPVPISDAGGSITVDGSVTVSGTVTANEGTKTLVAVSGTVAATGDLVASPGAGYRIVVVAFILQNEVATAQTAQIHAEGTATEGFRLFTPADAAGSGLRMEFPAGREWRLGEDEDLEVTLSAATTVGFSVLYFVEAV